MATSAGMHVKFDGGKSMSTQSDERRDCAVRALAIAMDAPYDVAHALLKQAGRRDKRGTFRRQISAVLGRSIRQSGTVARFIKRHPEGRFVVRLNNHLTAVIDGRIWDNLSNPEQLLGRFVKHSWQVQQQKEKL